MSGILSQKQLNTVFLNALKGFIVNHSNIDGKPIDIDLLPPLPHKIRLYIYNITSPLGGRTLGEHKIQLRIPGQKRGETASFDDSGGRIVVLAGYDSELDVFAIWDAGLYFIFSYSRNVQVKAETIYEALAKNVGTQKRSIRGKGQEMVVTSTSKHLVDALISRISYTRKRLLGEMYE